jgi:hypothetical protein
MVLGPVLSAPKSPETYKKRFVVLCRVIYNGKIKLGLTHSVLILQVKVAAASWRCSASAYQYTADMT